MNSAIMGTRPLRAVITDFVNDDLAPERSVLGDIAHVEALSARHERELEGRIETADAIMLYHTVRLGRALLERLERCRLIVRCGVGYDNVDHEAAAELGIAVANVPDYGTEDVADTAIGLMLSLARGIHKLDTRCRREQGTWSYQEAAPLRRLRGANFGVVGLGRIGTATALRAKAFGMNVIYHDPYKPDGMDKALGIVRAPSLEALLERSNVLSLHCPLTDETRSLINDLTIAQLPRGAYVVNTARGPIVDPTAVVNALSAGHLGGAGLDVLPQEPPVGDEPIIRAWRDPAHPAHDRLIITPHAAFYSEDGLLDMRLKGAEACRRVLLGRGPIPNLVNAPVAVNFASRQVRP